MDNLADILGRKDFDVPREVTVIKRYVSEHFNVDVGVSVQPKTITITARNSSLVSSLRMHSAHLRKACETDKRILFRIG
jgi:hypothetical protein